jgi:uncharacterized protein (TIGR00725 family)
MSAVRARAIVGVMGSGTEEHEALARPVGLLLAELGVHLLTGGGGGVMRAVSRAFTRARGARGLSIGILPCASPAERAAPRPGYPNEFVELAIQTHLPHSGRLGTDDLSRNHINVLSCAAIVALPGGEGTAAEVSLALRYGRPLLVYVRDPASVAHFPGAAERSNRIDAVRRFLCAHLGDAT